MNERLKDVQERVLAFWNKYDKKRKVQLVSVTAAIVVMLIILAVVVSRPTYETLIECTDTTQAASITDVLTSNAIIYTTENTGLTIKVKEEDLVSATYLIAQSGYTAKGYSLDDYVSDVGFGTTTEDRKRLYQKYLEDKMRMTLESFDYVKSAFVAFSLPTTNYSSLTKGQDTFVAVTLTLAKDIPSGAAISMANYIATAVGNSSTRNVTIIDSKGTQLFINNETTDSNNLSQSQQLAIRNLYTEEIVTNVTRLFSNYNLYNSVLVAPMIDVSFDKVDIIDTDYRNPDEVKFNDYIYESEGGSSTGGIPGTDSNDDTTDYYLQTADATNTIVSVRKNEYAVSSTITHTTGEQGKWNKDKSTLSVVLNKYVVYDEETLRDNGELNNITWEQYKSTHGETKETEVQDGIDEMIAFGTGIPLANIKVQAYEIPVFNDYVSDTDFTTDILPIIIAVIILVLLGFIVWRSLRPVQVTELEPELSVEELLNATRDRTPVEEIDLDEKSEVRKAIEKFVDENPEAVALLMRNWLNDDWD